MAVWSVLKLGTELLEIYRTRFGQSRTDLKLEMVPLCYNCVLNYGLGVVGSEMAMDFGSTKWNRCLVRGLPTDSPLHVFETVKNSPGLLDLTKNVHEFLHTIA